MKAPDGSRKKPCARSAGHRIRSVVDIMSDKRCGDVSQRTPTLTFVPPRRNDDHASSRLNFSTSVRGNLEMPRSRVREGIRSTPERNPRVPATPELPAIEA